MLLTLPNNCPALPSKAKLFQVLVAMLHETMTHLDIIDETDSQSSLSPLPSPKRARSFTLVAHGLGCYVSLLYENSHADCLNRLILMDNGIRKTYLLSEIFYTFAYEWVFALIYSIHLHWSVCLATLLLKIFLLGSECYRLYTRREGNMHNICNVHSKMTYLYSHLLADRITGDYIQPHFPSTRLLFLYGEGKQAMLHDDEFIWNIHPKGVYVRQHSYEYNERDNTIAHVPSISSRDQDQDGGNGSGNGSGFRSLPGGHYFTRTQPQVILEEIRRFLQDS